MWKILSVFLGLLKDIGQVNLLDNNSASRENFQSRSYQKGYTWNLPTHKFDVKVTQVYIQK